MPRDCKNHYLTPGVDNPVCSFKNHGIQGGIQGFTMGFTRISILVRNSGIQGFILGIQGFTDGIQGFTVGIQEYLQNFSFGQGIQGFTTGIQGFTDSLLGFRDLGRSEILNSRPVHTYTRKTLYLRMHTCEIAYLHLKLLVYLCMCTRSCMNI